METAVGELHDLARVVAFVSQELIKRSDALSKNLDDDEWEDKLNDCFAFRDVYVGIARSIVDMEKLGVKLPEIPDLQCELSCYVAQERAQRRLAKRG